MCTLLLLEYCQSKCVCVCVCDTVERPSNGPIETCTFVLWRGSPPLRFKLYGDQYRPSLFHTVWLFSIPSGSIPYRLALFHTVWLYSIPSGSIPYHLAPFHTVCLYSIQRYRSEGSRTEDTGPDYQANRQNTVHIHC